MIITSSIEKELNSTLAGMFEEVEPTPEQALFTAKSKLKDAYNMAFIVAAFVATGITMTVIAVIQ